MNFEEKTLESKYLFEGRVIKLRYDKVELPNGKESDREVIEHPGGVAIVPITENQEILMVRQFRYPYKELVLEIPAGKLTPGEDPFECGKRELKEETGAEANKYMDLGVIYPTPGCMNEKIYLYAAKEFTFGAQNLDEDEFLSVERIPLQKAVEMSLSGEIRDAKTLAGILKVYALMTMNKQ